MAIIKDFFSGKTVSAKEVQGSEREAKQYVRAVIDYIAQEDDDLSKDLSNMFNRHVKEGLTPAQRMEVNRIKMERRNNGK